MSATITEAQVIDFMRAASARLARETGVSYAEVRLSHQNDGDETQWDCYVDGGEWYNGRTLDEAITAQVAAMSPANRIARLRAEAAQKLAEAAALAQEATP